MDDLSEFKRAISEVSEGRCPLCGVRLADHTVNRVEGTLGETVESVTAEIGDLTGAVVCFRCRVGWHLQDAGGTPAHLVTSRSLSAAELRSLQSLEGTE